MTVESEEHKAHAQVVSSNEATIAAVSILIDGVTHTWEGTAKRSTGDKFNPEIGRKLALARALSKAGRQLERQANGLVKSAEDNRLQALAATKKPVPSRFRVSNSAKSKRPRVRAAQTRHRATSN